MAAEGHARLAAPLYNVALVILALCFMVRGEHLRLGYGRRIAICAFAGFTIRLSGFGITSAAESTPHLNIIQYLVPMSVIILVYIYLILMVTFLFYILKDTGNEFSNYKWQCGNRPSWTLLLESENLQL